MSPRAHTPAVPRLTYLRIKNYRTLRDVEFHDLTPLTVLIGPNGSGKSTVLDALDFLAEAVRGNLVGAWEKRNRFQGMRTRGSEGNISIELEIGPTSEAEFLRYFLEIAEVEGKVMRFDETLTVKKSNGEGYPLFMLKKGEVRPFVSVVVYEKFEPDEEDIANQKRTTEAMETAVFQTYNNLALPVFTSLEGAIQPRAECLFSFITGYRNIQLTDEHQKSFSTEGPREKLSPNGDNLPNVLYYLHTKHPETLANITAQMRKWVPALADIVPEITSDERILLRFKDAQFEKPMPAQYMSDGTMRLAALLTLLYEPGATGLLGLEEPENELHPLLLAHLAEELIAASDTRQLLVATHSPALLNALAPEQVWILHRGADGYTQATRTADLPGIAAMVEEGTPLGYLWSRNFFDVGNPLDLPTPVK